MTTNVLGYTKAVRVRRALVIGLLILLGIAVTTGFVWFQTAHIIAPPGLRLMDELWTLFICRCPPL